ncbi:hypothetical protein VNO77_00553 [Canavalia gladiata]|uniref:Uncharacterized protein n=1 Tax=Canavalia gladiata TaxID=3824 RepID=A0AAN9MUF1_CANGL
MKHVKDEQLIFGKIMLPKLTSYTAQRPLVFLYKYHKAYYCLVSLNLHMTATISHYLGYPKFGSTLKEERPTILGIIPIHFP